MRRRFYAGLAWVILRLSPYLPLSWGRRLGVGLAQIAAWVRPRQWRLAQANLALALPELSQDERDVLLISSMRHLGRNLFHTLIVPRLLATPGAVVEEPAAGPGDQSIGAWLAELSLGGQGVFILGGHIGCWELTGGWLAQVIREQGGGPLAVVTGTIHNPPVDRMAQNWRRDLGLLPLPREAGIAPLLKILKDGGMVAILLDQLTEVRNLDATFFGQPTPTPVALAAMALKESIPVLPIAGMWDNERRIHVMKHLPPIWPQDFARDDRVGFLTACNQALESFIRGNPEQWVWFHQRWQNTEILNSEEDN